MKRGNDTKENRDVVADYLGLADAPRTYKIVQMRLEGSTLETIRAEIGISRERIRQILATFQRRLRNALQDSPARK